MKCMEIQPVHPKGNQSWVFIGKTDVEAETPIFWLPDAKSWHIWKDPDVGKDWGKEEKGMTEDEMVRWHHWLDTHEFGWTLGVGDGQGGLACCSSWGHKESDTTERLNWTELMGLDAMNLAFWMLSFKPTFSLSSFTFMHWRRKWQPTPVFLPRESQGWGSLVDYHLWGCTESDTAEVT